MKVLVVFTAEAGIIQNSLWRGHPGISQRVGEEGRKDGKERQKEERRKREKEGSSHFIVELLKYLCSNLLLTSCGVLSKYRWKS